MKKIPDLAHEKSVIKEVLLQYSWKLISIEPTTSNTSVQSNQIVGVCKVVCFAFFLLSSTTA